MGVSAGEAGVGLERWQAGRAGGRGWEGNRSSKCDGRWLLFILEGDTAGWAIGSCGLLCVAGVTSSTAGCDRKVFNCRFEWAGCDSTWQ